MSAVRFQELPGVSGPDVTDVCIGRHTGRLVALANGSRISIWSLGRKHSSKQELVPAAGASADPITAVQFRHGEEFIVSGSRSGTVRIWDTQFGKVVRHSSHHAAATEGGASDSALRVTAVAFRPAGDGFATAAADGSVALWDLGSARKDAWLRFRTNPSNPGSAITALHFCADGRSILVADAAGTLAVWDSNSGSCVRTIRAASARGDMLAEAVVGGVPTAVAPTAALRVEFASGRPWCAVASADASVEILHTESWASLTVLKLCAPVSALHFPKYAASALVAVHLRGIQELSLTETAGSSALAVCEHPLIPVQWAGCRDIHVTKDFQLFGCEAGASSTVFWLCSLHCLKSQAVHTPSVMVATLLPAPSAVPACAAATVPTAAALVPEMKVAVPQEPVQTTVVEPVPVAESAQELLASTTVTPAEEDDSVSSRPMRTRSKARQSMVPSAAPKAADNVPVAADQLSARRHKRNSIVPQSPHGAGSGRQQSVQLVRSAAVAAAPTSRSRARPSATTTTAVATVRAAPPASENTAQQRLIPAPEDEPVGIKPAAFLPAGDASEEAVEALRADHSNMLAVLQSRAANLKVLRASLNSFDNGGGAALDDPSAARVPDSKRAAIALISMLSKLGDAVTSADAIAAYLATDPQLSFSVCALLLNLLVPALSSEYQSIAYRALESTKRLADWTHARLSASDFESSPSVQKYYDAWSAAATNFQQLEASGGLIGNLAKEVAATSP